MSDSQPDPQSPAGEAPTPASPRRLAGSITLRELEEREREFRRRAEQAARRHFVFRTTISILLGLALLGMGISWRQLNRNYYQAAVQLKVIRNQLEVQLPEVLRYAPLLGKPSDPARRKLEDAHANLTSSDLAERVQAIETVQSFLAVQAPRARSRFRSEYGSLYPEFSERLDLSNAAIQQRTTRYNTAARDYNKLVRGFPANLVRLILRYPQYLPPLKQPPTPQG